jgi:hypothetical protein
MLRKIVARNGDPNELVPRGEMDSGMALKWQPGDSSKDGERPKTGPGGENSNGGHALSDHNLGPHRVLVS